MKPEDFEGQTEEQIIDILLQKMEEHDIRSYGWKTPYVLRSDYGFCPLCALADKLGFGTSYASPWGDCSVRHLVNTPLHSAINCIIHSADNSMVHERDVYVRNRLMEILL